jgi:hypothetical protein
MRPAAAIAIFALLPLSVALADVYRSIDAQGHVLYSDTPTPGAELVKVTNNSQRYTAPSKTPAAGLKAAPPPPAAHSQLVNEEATRSVQSDVAQTRADQCKKAQDRYQQVITARRIYSQGADGERTYQSDAEADQTRVAAKLDMDDACKNSQ